MLTKKDLRMVDEMLSDRLRFFVTKTELDEFRHDLKNDILSFKDAILGELKAIREDNAAALYRQMEHSDQLGNHEKRLVKLEAHAVTPSL